MNNNTNNINKYLCILKVWLKIKNKKVNFLNVLYSLIYIFYNILKNKSINSIIYYNKITVLCLLLKLTNFLKKTEKNIFCKMSKYFGRVKVFFQ